MLVKMLRNIELDERKVDLENRAAIKDKENFLIRMEHDHNEILQAFEQQIRKEQELIRNQEYDYQELGRYHISSAF